MTESELMRLLYFVQDIKGQVACISTELRTLRNDIDNLEADIISRVKQKKNSCFAGSYK